MRKKWIAGLLAISMIAAMGGCSGAGTSSSSKNVETSAAESNIEESSEEESSQSETSTAESSIEELEETALRKQTMVFDRISKKQLIAMNLLRINTEIS